MPGRRMLVPFEARGRADLRRDREHRGRPTRSPALAGQGGPMLIARRPLTLLLLALGSPAALAQPPGLARQAPPPPMAAAAIANDVARWDDRTTPRKTLETFYFAITGYDRSPGLIVNAIDCLDLAGLDPEMRERDAALLAHQLEFILNRLGIPLYAVPD